MRPRHARQASLEKAGASPRTPRWTRPRLVYSRSDFSGPDYGGGEFLGKLSGCGLAVVACGGLRKRDQSFELGAGCARVNGFGGEAHAIEKIGGAACGDESASCIGEHNFAVRAMLAVKQRASQDFVDDLGVVCSIAAANGFDGRAAQAEIFGRDGVAAHSAIAQFGDVRFATDGNFVQAIGAVNHQRALHAQFAESLGDELGEACVVHADNLRGCPGGIGQRAEQVEDGADAQLAARGNGVTRGGVHRGGVEEADADLFDGFGDAFRREFNFYAERFEHVGGAAARAGGAIAVFGDAHAGSGDDEGDRGGNVERAARVAARAAGVHDYFVGMFAAGGKNWRGVSAHGQGEADDFVHGFTFYAQRDQQGGDLLGARVAGKDLLHRSLRFGAREVCALN
jgi:hypothetical protein